MPYRRHIVDLNKFPPEARNELKLLAEQYNAFVEDVNRDMIAILGSSTEEREETKGFFSMVHVLGKWIHSKRVNVWMTGLSVAAITYVLKSLGVPTEKLGSLIELIAKHLLQGL